MSGKKQDLNQTATKLLTEEERLVCQNIAGLDKGIVSQQAASLLDTDSGLTRTKTSERTGLTVGQIQYLLSKFQEKRLAIFPDDVLGEKSPAKKISDKNTKTSKDESESKKERASKKAEKKEKDKKTKSKNKKPKVKVKKKDKKKLKKSKAGKKSKKKKGKSARKKKK